MRTAKTILTVIHERGKQDKPLERVYKLLFNRELYLIAYAKLYPNNGAMTKGVTEETIDGMSIQKIDMIIEQLKQETYYWRPARREYIPKKNGKHRPLGIPVWSDKLLQEVIRMILEAYYEPQFSEHSHGFRPKRGCHTALQEIQTWKGTRWFIEGDISSYFDTIDHDVLITMLSRQIQDGRFIRLIKNMLEAGYLDDWKFHKTISGTPQGGVISPLLANIYLHQFDKWVGEELIPQYTRGKKQKANSAYNRLSRRIKCYQDKGDYKKAHQLIVERRNLPSVDTYDTSYRRLRYVRYADDFILGFTGSKAEAKAIKKQIGDFLNTKLSLELSQEKTLITHATGESAKFLGYEIKAQRVNDYIDNKGRRSANGVIALFVPASVIESKCRQYMKNGKAIHRNNLLHDDDFSIVQTYQQEYRGLVQYYILAQNLSWFSKVYWYMETSLLKTLSFKHKSSINKMLAKYKTTTTSTNGRTVPCLQVVVPREDKPPLVATWGGISLSYKKKAVIEDAPYQVYGGRTELIKRLLANKCELCGSEENIEVHHIRKLADLNKHNGKSVPKWKEIMSARCRKTLVTCRDCHYAIHNGSINTRL
ncbi:TPA: reverse transcriptase domain-containing protein [Streptococcus suis]|uniref:reverse transcriptase/maturase family protein n=1 Tax=Streptococcus suis TaxID=1307 RepID=UPI0009437E75|nr:reverse transcriptase/maturase family protein [Streptococcus suis]UYX34377.1 reverse transcriptase domain-containing protein [Streptococcus suis]WQC98827.1 reverse transcriptase domain-containing protein [Streptococcus suis]HEL2073054.1 reverse transcriptase [Streptococcus suis]HEL2074739.1 reverse transcriptase [Streptococcus suis]HEM2642609.1 reverse transcriptase [Streptococcus suis]